MSITRCVPIYRISLKDLFFLLAIFVCTSFNASGFSLFGGKRGKLLKEADLAYEAATTAGAEGRALDAVTKWNDARAKYHDLLKEYPDYKTEYVADRLDRCTMRMRVLTSKISSGEIKVPTPEQVMAGHGSDVVAPSGNDVGDRGKTSPENMDGFFEDILPTYPSSEERGKGGPEMRGHKDGGSADRSAGVRIPAVANPDKSTGQNADLSKMSYDDRRRTVLYLLDSARATDAVLSLDDVIEKEGEKTSPETRLLFVRALMERGNYGRAKEQLDLAARALGQTPAVRTMSAALAVGINDLPNAMYQLDRLVGEHPDFADTYVNLAYLSILMDPLKNRDMAVSYYKVALKKGAERDPKLERELKIELE